MDALFSKKASLKRRASLSLLFGSQKPTFAAVLDEKPTRYYDFVDTPSPPKRPSPFISRQEISPELESKIRYSCSLLAYRIEQGIPSPPNNAYRRAVRDAPVESITPKSLLVSNYPTPKAGPESASVTGYDSGVGLTQQPSMQTMRVLHSRSGEASDAGDTRAVSIFSNTRTGTSCSDLSTEPSCAQSSSHSPRQNELKPTIGATITGYRQPNHSAKAFLIESSLPLSEPPPYKEDAQDTNVFLNPTITNLSSETLSSHPSPRLGLARVPALTQQPKPTFTPNNTNLERSRSIIIDGAGQARLLTPDEESQRNKALQHAVLSKMTPGFMRYNPVRVPPRRQCQDNQPYQSPVDSDGMGSTYRENGSQAGLQRMPSRFGLSWSDIKSELHASRRKDTGTGSRRLRDEVPLVGKLSKLFSRERRN
ncbi:uncharacterized protein DSM5745_05574 [Aspergillus mulundensis]|uniref:Uncharacterized protein n=1 Tax=Aspergillus mulundensis TaxID=1810919 RepID=A0A3D8RXC8_9EURO|nr:Uncharacterized protein DSM5745_05574 [Aspergillus mulundensis]RDW78722.1 Uncharacterized protein DSM5745_05574 [Aspergillus mulundensis]